MQPVVNIHDQKSPVMMVAVLGMLTIQMMVLGLIAWRLLFPTTNTQLAQQQRNDVYREMLGQIVSGDPQEGPKIIKRVEELASRNHEMKTDLDGRSLMITDLQNRNQELQRDYRATEKALETKSDKVVSREKTIDELKVKLATEKEVNADIKEGKSIGGFKWPMVTAIGIGTALLGLFSGTFIGRRFGENDEFYQDQQRSDQGGRSNPAMPANQESRSQGPSTEIPPGESSIPDLTIRDQTDKPNESNP